MKLPAFLLLIAALVANACAIHAAGRSVREGLDSLGRWNKAMGEK